MSALVSTAKCILAPNETIYNFARKSYRFAKDQNNKMKINHENKKLRNRIVEDWQEILAQLEVCNAYTQTYTLKDFGFTKYGMEATVMFPKALTKEGFEDILGKLEQGIEAIIVPKYGQGKRRFFTVNIVAKDILQIPFAKVITKPYELFLGHGLDTMPIIWDISKNPHVLISGATGSGKSKFIMSIMTNLTLNATEREIEIYSLQIDKSDSYPFRRCKQVKCFADSLEKSLAVLNYINHLLDERDKDIRPLLDAGLGENIKEFNKLNSAKGWKYAFVWIDEFPSYMISQGDPKPIKEIKYRIMQRIERIYQIGRYARRIPNLWRSKVNNRQITIFL